jgi:type IV pilus assembly protein PilQ
MRDSVNCLLIKKGGGVKNSKIIGFTFCLLTFSLVIAAYAQDSSVPAAEASATAAEAQVGAVEDLAASQNVTLDFKEADIRNVLKIISMKAGVNVVTTADVIGNVTIRLVDVPWEQALDAILKTHGFAYDKQGNIIIVAPIDKLTAQKKQEVELAQVQPTATEVFALRYLDAQDAKKAIEPQLSPRGKITMLEMTGQVGWEFSGAELGKRKRAQEAAMGRSKVLIITDIVPVLDKLRAVIEKIDVKPLQILIETRIMEVSRDKLKDFGFDWGTGSTGAGTSAIVTTTTGESTAAGGHTMTSLVKPSAFGPKAADITGILPFNTGLAAMFQKLSGTQFEVIMHALEEDALTNTLSAPSIMALNNQEATILVGTRYPILKKEVTTSGSTPVETITLDYYQDIGIQLNVVPQVGADNHINMVVHPAVTSFSQTLSDQKYPIIEMREAETRILMKDGETVVIGGLLKDIKTKSRQGIPFLSKIPLLGVIFSRDTYDTGKLDLLIFITAHVVKEGEFTPEEIAKFQQRIQPTPVAKTKKKTRQR